MTNKQIVYLCLYFIFSIVVFLYIDLPYLGQLSLIIFVLSLGLFLLTNMPAGLSAFIALTIGILLGIPEKILLNIKLTTILTFTHLTLEFFAHPLQGLLLGWYSFAVLIPLPLLFRCKVLAVAQIAETTK